MKAKKVYMGICMLFLPFTLAACLSGSNDNRSIPGPTDYEIQGNIPMTFAQGSEEFTIS